MGGYRLGRQFVRHFVDKERIFIKETGGQSPILDFLKKYEHFLAGAFGSAVGLCGKEFFL